jgi:hypothetical protein
MEGRGDAAIMRRQLVARARGAAHSILASLSETEKHHLFRSPGQLCLAVGQTPPPRGGVASESDVDVILTRAVHRATNQTIRRLISAGDLLRVRRSGKATPPRHMLPELSADFDHDSGRSMWPEPLLELALTIQLQVETNLLAAVRTCLPRPGR